MFSVAVSAQSRYVVYKTHGDVLVNKFRTQEWVGLKKNDQVLLMDIVKISKEGSLVVLDNKNRKLYRIDGAKEKSVKALIDETIRQSDNITSNLNKELLSGNNSSGSSTDANTRLAATFRGMNGSASYLDSLALFISEKVEVGPACWYFDHQDLSDRIMYSITRTADEEIYFTFSNKLPHDIFVNVIYTNDKGICSLCYEFDYSSEYPFVLVPAGMEVSMPQYRFAASDGDDRYCILATEKVYDSHALQVMLNK